MDWWLPLRDSLLLMEQHIPYQAEGPLHSRTTRVYGAKEWSIDVAQPGRHAQDLQYSNSQNPGGDFALLVTGGPWSRKELGYAELFVDVSEKWRHEPGYMRRWFGPALCAVTALGECPLHVAEQLPELGLPGLSMQPLLASCHLLALADHRRYGKLERVGGGRFLPTRFLLGLLEGVWTVEEMKRYERQGLPGYRRLVSEKLGSGQPPLIRDYVNRWYALPAETAAREAARAQDSASEPAQLPLEGLSV